MSGKRSALLTDFLFRFTMALYQQLESDHKRWGDTWRHRSREGQEDRAYQRFEQYWVEFSRDGKPIPWLKIAGEAMIAWVRENYPETLDLKYVDPD